MATVDEGRRRVERHCCTCYHGCKGRKVERINTRRQQYIKQTTTNDQLALLRAKGPTHLVQVTQSVVLEKERRTQGGQRTSH